MMKKILFAIFCCILLCFSICAKDIPGTINAADFVSSDGGKIERNTDDKGLKQLGGIKKGDFFLYDIDCKESGKYLFSYRVSCAREAQIKVSLVNESNEVTELEKVSLPGSGGWRNWVTYVGTQVDLPAGKQRVRVDVLADGFVFNWFSIENFSPHAVPGIIKTVNYTKHQGGAAEPTVEAFGGQQLGKLSPGNYFIYAIDMKKKGDYSISYRLSAMRDGLIKLYASKDGVNFEKLDEVLIPQSGGWKNYTTIPGNAIKLTKDIKFLKIEVLKNGFVLNWIQIK